MSSQTMVVVFVSLATACQMAICADPMQTLTVKNNYRHPALAQAGLKQDIVGRAPTPAKVQVGSERRIEPQESGAIAREVGGQDGNERFTRMSCCP